MGQAHSRLKHLRLLLENVWPHIHWLVFFSDWNIDSIPVGMIDWVWHILITAKLNELAGGL